MASHVDPEVDAQPSGEGGGEREWRGAVEDRGGDAAALAAQQQQQQQPGPDGMYGPPGGGYGPPPLRDGLPTQRMVQRRGGDWDCPQCGNLNFLRRIECHKCHMVKPGMEGQAPAPRDDRRPFDDRSGGGGARDRRPGDWVRLRFFVVVVVFRVIFDFVPRGEVV